MSHSAQTPLPVVSTTRFFVGPNESLDVQGFLRNVTRSSRAAKAASKLRGQATVRPDSEPLALPRTSGSPKTSEPFQHPQVEVSNQEQSSLVQRSASGECNTSIRDSPPSPNTKRHKIKKTYSKKKKSLSPGAPTSEIVPPTSHPSVTPSDPRRNAGSQVLTVDLAAPGVNPNGPTPTASLDVVEVPSWRSTKLKPKEAARGEIINPKEQRPTKRKMRRRRASVDGLVCVHGISEERPCSSESEAQNPNDKLGIDSDPVKHQSAPIPPSPGLKRKRAAKILNRNPAREPKRSIVSSEPENVDVGEFRIPHPPTTPSVERVSEWTPGSGFVGFNIEVNDRRKQFKPVSCRARHPEPVSLMKGRTLDLTTKQQSKALAKEAPNDRGTQCLGTLEPQLETDIVSDETISTRRGGETRGLQPTGNAEAIETEQLGKQRGWLKRAKEAHSAASTSHVGRQDQIEISRGDSLPLVVAEVDVKEEVSNEYGTYDTRRDRTKQIRNTRTDSEVSEDDDRLDLRSNTAGDLSLKVKPIILDCEEATKTRQRNATVQRNPTISSLDAHQGSSATEDCSSPENEALEKAWDVIEDMRGNNASNPFQQGHLLWHVPPPHFPPAVPSPFPHTLRPSASEIKSQSQGQRAHRAIETREPSNNLPSVGPQSFQSHVTVSNGDLTFATQSSNYHTIPTSPSETHTYFANATAQLSSSSASKPVPSKTTRRKIHSLGSLYGSSSRSKGSSTGLYAAESQGRLALGVTPRLKRKMSRMPFIPPFKKK